MFETCCNLSATNIASSCRDKNRLCKRALRWLEQASAHKTRSSHPNPFTGIPPFCFRFHDFLQIFFIEPCKEKKADRKQITQVKLLYKTNGNMTSRQQVFCTYHRCFHCFISNLQLVGTRCIKRTVDLKLVHLATDNILSQQKIVKVEWDTCRNLKDYDVETVNNQRLDVKTCILARSLFKIMVDYVQLEYSCRPWSQ